MLYHTLRIILALCFGCLKLFCRPEKRINVLRCFRAWHSSKSIYCGKCCAQLQPIAGLAPVAPPVCYYSVMSKPTGSHIQPLKMWNISAGLLHLASLIAVLSLSNNFSLPITATYMTGPPGTTFTEPILLFSSNVSYTVALFLGLSAFFHFLVSSKKFFPRYAEGLKQSRNIFRWVEYSLSSSLMIFLIAQINGISDYAALMAISGVNVLMILFGWLQEKYAQPGNGQWLPFIFGSIAGAIPWIIIVTQLLSPGGPEGASAPGFVYGIVISLFVLFNCFALVQYKQYRAKGKWANYLRGEKAYIILSFVAKSLLAWQIFAATLVG